MSENRYIIGKEGEQRAWDYLTGLGWKTIERNFQNRWGEIDLIMGYEDWVIFVEVKYKKDDRMGKPEEMINRRKIRQIKLIGQLFLEKKENLKYKNCRLRIDAVCITGDTVKHYQQIDD